MITVKAKGYTTIMVARGTRNKLIAIKIKTNAKNLSEVISNLVRQYA